MAAVNESTSPSNAPVSISIVVETEPFDCGRSGCRRSLKP